MSLGLSLSHEHVLYKPNYECTQGEHFFFYFLTFFNGGKNPDDKHYGKNDGFDDEHEIWLFYVLVFFWKQVHQLPFFIKMEYAFYNGIEHENALSRI